MAFEVTASLLGHRVEPPLRSGPPSDRPDVGMEINEACWGCRRRRAWRAGGNATGQDKVDSILGVSLLMVAMDVVMAAFTGGAHLVNAVDEVHPMEVILPVDRVVKVCSRAVAGSPGRERGYVMAAKAEIKVVGVPARRSRKSVLEVSAADASVS